MQHYITFTHNIDYKHLFNLVQTDATASLLINQDGRILTVSSIFLKATGFQWESLRDKSFTEIFHTDEIEEIYQDFIESDGMRIPKLQWKNLSGDSFYSRYAIYRGENKTGEFLYALHLIDVTNIDSRLDLLQRFASAMINDIHFGVIIVDKHYNLFEISDMACKILGLERNAVLNQPIDRVFSSMPEDQRIIQKPLLDGVSLRNYPFTWSNNQQRYELIMDTNVLKDEQGGVVGAYVVFKDVTNTRSLEQQIQRHDRLAMIGQIAAGTAHEIRNPLTSIKGFLQVLKQTLNEKGLSKETDFADIMLTEINRINSLVSEFLMLSKPRDIQFQLIDVHSVWKDLLPIIDTEAILHNVVIKNEMLGQLPMVVADRELLKQVFLNVCKNGIEAMPDGGTLTISYQLFNEEQKLSIDIHDTGPGIPPLCHR